MMRRLVAVLSLLGLLLIPAQTALAAYNPLQDACTTPGGSQSSACQDNENGSKNTLTGSNGIIGKITKIVALIAGIAAVIIIIISGFMFVTSGGDPQQAASARSTIIYAAIGLVIIILAQALILFILSKVK